MNGAVLCHGCGQKFALPPGYGRGKIQCPECGVICPVPADAWAAPEELPVAGPSAPSPAPTPTPFAAAETAPAPVPAAGPEPRTWRDPAPSVWTCHHCGEWQPRRPRGRKAKCPVCGVAAADPAREAITTKDAAQPAAPLRRPPAQAEWSDEDDGKP